jgi:hypothetical protein
VATVDLDLGAYQLGWRDEVEYAFTPRKGLDEDVIRDMSAMSFASRPTSASFASRSRSGVVAGP